MSYMTTSQHGDPTKYNNKAFGILVSVSVLTQVVKIDGDGTGDRPAFLQEAATKMSEYEEYDIGNAAKDASEGVFVANCSMPGDHLIIYGKGQEVSTCSFIYNAARDFLADAAQKENGNLTDAEAQDMAADALAGAVFDEEGEIVLHEKTNIAAFGEHRYIQVEQLDFLAYVPNTNRMLMDVAANRALAEKRTEAVERDISAE